MDNSGMDVSASDINQAPVEAVAKTSSERVFTQSELNEIVGRAKHEAVESHKRQSTQQAPQQQSYAPQPSNSRTLSEDDVKRLTSEELTRQRDDWERQSLEKQNAAAAERIVNNYKDKIAAGRDKYEDFDKVTSSLDMRHYPNVVQLLADHVDNASDILYDLAQNRTKLYQLESTCAHNPDDAIYEINRLSNSLKTNDDASRVRSPNSPLSQTRPSHTGTDSGGALSMQDLKRKYRA